jgi:hypothetical protein
MAPLMPMGLSCSGGLLARLGSLLGFGGANPGPAKPAGNPMKRQANGAKPGAFSIFIAKGNEGDANVYPPINTSDVKSGY